MPTLEEFQEEKPTADGRQPKAKGSKRKPAKKKTGKKA